MRRGILILLALLLLPFAIGASLLLCWIDARMQESDA